MLGKTQTIHFIGIGGIGMSGMAELLFKLGFNMTGSDQAVSDRTTYLQSLGIKVYEGHSRKNITNADVVVYSSAVKLDNPEVIEAQRRNIPVIRRAEMLGELLKLKKTSIAISGTHGKTTSSSMLGSILTETDLDPTLVIGGIVNKFQTNAISGKGDIIVVEADEFDRTFLSLQPTMAVITNLDLEHLDCYENLTDLQNTFSQFVNSVPFYGKVIVCIDKENIQNIFPSIKRPIVTYGFSQQADVRAQNVHFENNTSHFDVVVNNTNLGKIILNTPGKHNIENALSAIAICLELDIEFSLIQRGLEKYAGVRRRFEILHTTQDNITIVDDYAHHPTEVEATLTAASSGWDKRIIAIFQPHLFTRTRDFYKDFARAFQIADVLIVTEIFPAREKPIEGITGQLISESAKIFGHKHVHFIDKVEKIPTFVKQIAQKNDMIITMGAGSIWRQAKPIFEELNS
jgi:UDP-N-acetylmuramate--alanine ligase